MEMVSSSSSSQLAGITWDAAARNCSYGSPGAPVSAQRITVTLASSSGATRASSSTSSKR